jgi:MinD-like ATPase involved in chromosome partitioning or flagellar assembly
MDWIWSSVKTEILIAFGEATWQLEIINSLNNQKEIKIRRRCIDNVDLLAAAQLNGNCKVILTSDFPDLNLETIKKLNELKCEIFAIYLKDDISGAEKLINSGIKNLYPFRETDLDKTVQDLLDTILGNTKIVAENLEDSFKIPGLISIWGSSGSPGRTSLAINLAFVLAQKKLPTLLIDLDAVSPSLAASLGLVSEVSGISSVIHDAIKLKFNSQSLDSNLFEVQNNLHVLTGITNSKRWPELRTEGLISVLQYCSQQYANIVCDLSSILPEANDSSLNDIDIFKRFDHIPAVLQRSSRVIFVSGSTPLALIRASESLETLHEIIREEPLIVLNRINQLNLGNKYVGIVEDIFGRWVNPTEIVKIPEDLTIFAQAWLQAESVLNLGNKEVNLAYQQIAQKLENHVISPLTIKHKLRKVS